MMGISPHDTRTTILEALRQAAPLDVLIIGGGIHGASIAKIAAESGLSVGLLERDDYASATSSRSSKMAHGGLRYLEMFDFQQVFEGIKAREALFEQCPNLVRPEHFLIPVPRGDHFFRIKLGIGLKLYDLMVKNAERHHSWISRRNLTFESFHADREDLEGVFVYTDGLMNDARIVLDQIVAAREKGALCLNYSCVDSLKQDSDRLVTIGWRDLVSQERHEIKARVIVNCSGPWAPFLIEDRTAPDMPQVKYSRGTHLLFKIPWRDPSLFLPMAERGRYYFVWPHSTGTMVGTTEREVSSLDLDPQPSRDEVEEILGRLAKDLPHSGLNRESLHYAFAGVRTLPMRGTRRGVSQLSRKHIWRVSRGVVTLLGGKFTTFAWTAGEGLRLVLKELGRDSKRSLHPLFGLQSFITPDKQTELRKKVLSRHQCNEAALTRALTRLGASVERYIDRSELWRELIPGVLLVELAHAIEVEQAQTIEDILRRRLDLEFTPTHGREAIPIISKYLRALHSDDDVAREISKWEKRIAALHHLMEGADI